MRKYLFVSLALLAASVMTAGCLGKGGASPLRLDLFPALANIASANELGGFGISDPWVLNTAVGIKKKSGL